MCVEGRQNKYLKDRCLLASMSVSAMAVNMIDLDICPDCFDKLIDGFAEECAINPIKENF